MRHKAHFSFLHVVDDVIASIERGAECKEGERVTFEGQSAAFGCVWTFLTLISVVVGVHLQPLVAFHLEVDRLQLDAVRAAYVDEPVLRYEVYFGGDVEEVRDEGVEQGRRDFGHRLSRAEDRVYTILAQFLFEFVDEWFVHFRTETDGLAVGGPKEI